MTLYNPATGTATVSAGTASVTIAGADITAILPGMAIYFGSRDTLIAPAYIISTVTPSGTSGGNITLRSSVPSTITTQPFVVDMRSGGNATGFATFVLGRIISALQGLVGAGSSIDGNSRVLELDKTTAGALSWLRYKIAGVNQFEISQRTIGGIETLALRSTNDGATFVDALQVRRTDGLVTFANLNVSFTQILGKVQPAQVMIDATADVRLGGSVLSASGYTGFFNTGGGFEALKALTSGDNNVAFGKRALLAATTAARCTAVGADALGGLTTFSNCTGLGADTAVTGSNQVQLGSSSTTTYVYGTVQNRSDERDKADIRPTKLGLEFVLSLNPVDYRWDLRDDYKPPMPERLPEHASIEQRNAYEAALLQWQKQAMLKSVQRDGSKKRSRFHSGLVVQEVAEAVKAAGFDNRGWGAVQDHSVSGGDDVMTLGYDQFIAPLIRAVQEQQQLIEGLTARVAALEAGKV